MTFFNPEVTAEWEKPTSELPDPGFVSFNKVPTASRRSHTSFILCNDAGGYVSIMPNSNFELLSQKDQEEFKAEVAALGLKLRPPPRKKEAA